MLTALNGLRLARQYGPGDVAAGRFDPATLTEHHSMGWRDAAGEHEVLVRERGFAPSELALCCRMAGLQVDHLWGGTAGNWGRRPVELDEMEVMVVGRRPEVRAGDPPPADGDAFAQVSLPAAVDAVARVSPPAIPDVATVPERAAAVRPLIRAVTPGDAAAVSRILNEIIVGGRHSVLDRTFTEAQERSFIEGFPKRGVFLVAELPGEGMTGFQALEPYLGSSSAFDHVATMGTWVVDTRRRRGIGDTLCAATFAAARRNGFEKIFTDIRADNAESLAFHRAMGFVEVGRAMRQARYGARYVDIIYVERDLRRP